MARRIHLTPTGGQDSPMIQDALDNYGHVYLEPGAEFSASGLWMTDGKIIETDPLNPAIIKRDPDYYAGRKRIITMLGSGNRIMFPKLDVNHAAGWQEFVALIAMEWQPWHNHMPYYSSDEVADNKIIGVIAFDSANREHGDQPINGNGDCWLVVWKTQDDGVGSLTSMRRMEVIGCQQLSKHMQLTAGGGASGDREDIEIVDSYCIGGRSNAVAMSARSVTAEDQRFRRIGLRRLYLQDIERVGIFIGQDSDGDTLLSIDGLEIEDCYIRHINNPIVDFPMSILLKISNQPTNRGVNIDIIRNTFDRLDSRFPNTRTLSPSGLNGLPWDIYQSGNLYIGGRDIVTGNLSDVSIMLTSDGTNYDLERREFV